MVISESLEARAFGLFLKTRMEPQVNEVKGQQNLLFKFGHGNSSKTSPSASDKNQLLLARISTECYNSYENSESLLLPSWNLGYRARIVL